MLPKLRAPEAIAEAAGVRPGPSRVIAIATRRIDEGAGSLLPAASAALADIPGSGRVRSNGCARTAKPIASTQPHRGMATVGIQFMSDLLASDTRPG